MKQGGPAHPKVALLADLLNIDIWAAVGLVETLIHWISDYAPSGAIGRWNDSAIANGIHWKDDPGKLIDVLLKAGFLDDVTWIRCGNDVFTGEVKSDLTKRMERH